MTNSAWIDQREIVEVTFQPSQLSLETLIRHAVAHSCDQMIFTDSAEQAKTARAIVGPKKVQPFPGQVRQGKPSDQLYFLVRTSYRWVPMTPSQARRVNSDLFFQRDPQRWLSPRQIAWWKRIEAGRQEEAIAQRLAQCPSPVSPTTDLAAYVKELERALRAGK